MKYVKKGINNPRAVWLYVRDKFRDIVERPTSRVIFKNTAGFTNNIKGKLAISQVKKINFDNKTISPNQLSEEFKSKGYIKIVKPYDPELIKRISAKFNQTINDDKYSYVRTKDGDTVYSRQLYSGHKIIPDSVLLLNDEIIDIVEQYYQSHFKLTTFVFFRNHHVPKEVANKKIELLSSRWHCDAGNTSRVILYVYLTDVTEHDGPFHTQSIERTKELMKFGYKSRNNYNLPSDVLENKEYVYKITGDAGTSLMCNAHICLHRAGVPEPGHYRDIIQFQFAPSNEPLPKDWYKTFVDPHEPVRSRTQHNEPLDNPNT